MKFPKKQSGEMQKDYSPQEDSASVETASCKPDHESASTTCERVTSGVKGTILKAVLGFLLLFAVFTFGYWVGYTIHKCDAAVTASSPSLPTPVAVNVTVT